MKWFLGVVFLAALAGSWVGQVGPPSDAAAREVEIAAIPGENPAWGNLGRYAVVIGVSQYRDPAYHLGYADCDAKAFHEFLLTPQGGGFPPANIRLLLNEQATAQALRSAFGTFLAQTRPEDYVVIYFAGHGLAAPGRPDDLYLGTYETNVDDLAGTAFPMDEIRRYLEKSIPARRVVMFTDACRSGGVRLMGAKSGATDQAAFQRYIGRLTTARTGLAAVSASGASQYSAESPQYGGGHGVFTYYLLRGLNEDAALADLNGDHVVDLAEVYEYVRERVKKETGGQQIPDKTGDLALGFPLAATAPGESLQVLVQMFREDSEGRAREVKSGDALTSGDGYFFLLQPLTTCHLYLFQIDSSQKAFRLFPDPIHGGGNPVQVGRKLILPSEKELYFLDNTTGREEVVVFVSTSSLPDLETFTSGNHLDLDRGALKIMGPAGIRPRAAAVADQGRSIPASVIEIKAAGSMVYRFEFEHR